jgi:cell volume regulation protein A
MTISIIIIICVLLLFAYVFDITSSKTKIPPVILLLALGYLVKQVTVFFEISVPNLSTILPVFGTVGLILIVLEGSLELELDRSKLPFVGRTILIALLPISILVMCLSRSDLPMQYHLRSSAVLLLFQVLKTWHQKKKNL